MIARHRVAIISLSLVIGMATTVWLSLHRGPANSTPDEALDSLVHALKARNENSVRALTTKRGFADLRQAAEGYVEKGRALEGVIGSEQDHPKGRMAASGFRVCWWRRVA